MNSIAFILLQLVTFAAVAAGAYAGLRALDAGLGVRRRLSTVAAAGGGGSGGSSPASPLMRRQSVRNPVLKWVESAAAPAGSPDRIKLARDLSSAGFEQASAPVWYIIARFSLAIGLPLVFLLSQRLLPKPVGGLGLIVGALVLCGLGLVLPRFIINNRAHARREQLEHEFPDALDLMVVCVDAGLGIESAFIRVGEETRESHKRISHEFNRVSEELRAGKSRLDALRALADRTDVNSVRSFAALLIQTDALGTSIGQTLRTYSVEMRQHRFLAAEEKAMRIPVLMTIPLVACILPVIVTAVLLPPALDTVRTLVPVLNGRR